MKYTYNVKISGVIDAADQQDAIEKVKGIRLSKFPDLYIEMEEENVTNYIG